MCIERWVESENREISLYYDSGNDMNHCPSQFGAMKMKAKDFRAFERQERDMHSG